ncbi:hypothetical protein DPMN_141596 [Dreissena polymorpha]|uniref:Uncharacterized protein n=1 Tax=Dreissena polymorpha TaxID=45954 RepID=A0A9D4G9R8_DREPO|nr:hypothetical protein DPMN_141596 [Dreissena polymorpha]
MAELLIREPLNKVHEMLGAWFPEEKHSSIKVLFCITEIRDAPNITWYLDIRTPSEYSDDVDLTRNSRSSTEADVMTSMKQYGEQLSIPQVVTNANYTLDVINAMNRM